MVRKNIAIAICTLLLVAGSARAAEENPYFETVLIPLSLTPAGLPGDFGSLWRSQILVYNSSTEMVPVTQTPATGPIIELPPQPAQPLTMTEISAGTGGQSVGAIVYVARPGNESVVFSSRIQDVSRQALTWGTEIPVVRESDLLSVPVDLLGVPTDSTFRNTLRIYNTDGQNSCGFSISISHGDGALLKTTTVTVPAAQSDPVYPIYAGYVQLGDFLPPEPGTDPLRVTITPLCSAPRYWTFVSVTNNETQHVTTITPGK
ncbi:MAG: hypothetical protein ABI718_13015 [Acidobacteriota bacterium]